MPQHGYVLKPVMKGDSDDARAIIQAECLFEEGPGWAGLQTDLAKDPTHVDWPAQSRYERSKDIRAVLLPGQDRSFPLLMDVRGDTVSLLPQVLLTEGDRVSNPHLLEAFKKVLTKPQRPIAMRVGCGIWGTWYGYSGGGAERVKIWTDRESGVVLREEGYRDDALRFTIEHDEFQATADGRRVPQHVVVRLLTAIHPGSST